MKDYDIILVITNFRRAMVYLPILKELGLDYRIGIYRSDTDKDDSNKTRQTDGVFFELCRSLGAQFAEKYPLSTKLLFLPQWPYAAGKIATLKEHVNFDKCFILMGMMWGNLHMDQLEGIPVDAYLVVDRDLYYYRLSKRPEEEKLKLPTEKVIEVGLPFKGYPVFEDLDLDYIIAAPTPLSLPEPKDRAAFLKNVLRLLKHFNSEPDRIAYKPHNGDERYDYVVDKRFYQVGTNGIAKYLEPFLMIALESLKSLCALMDAFGLKKITDAVYGLLTAFYYRRLMKKVKPLNDLTPYHNFSLELMLPHVKKGLITGRSNTIWHGLYLKMPVYNCVDKRTIREDPTKMNYESMKLFETPFCNGEPTFDESYFSIVREEVREKDMIEYIRNTLEG